MRRELPSVVFFAGIEALSRALKEGLETKEPPGA